MSASDDAGYNIDGKQNVDPNIFLPEDAEHTDGEGVTPENNTPKTGDEPKGDEPELDTVKPSVEDGDGSPETADVENGKKPQDTITVDNNNEPKLLAGKYKSREDLETAFYSLGGDPTRYKGKGDEILEEAYEVRQSEFTRSRQQVRQQEPTPEPQNQNQTPSEDELVTQVLNEVDFSNIKDAKDLIGASIRASIKVLSNKIPDPDSIVARVQETNQKQDALTKLQNELEAEVPRLKTDPVFRDAFAGFLLIKKNRGTFSGDAKEELRQFTRSYVSGEAPASNPTPGKDSGRGLPQAPLNIANTSTPQGTDEVDDILGAFSDRQKRTVG